MRIDFDVSGRQVVIIDDMVSTGTTMIRAVEICKEAGAGKIYCGTTYGRFLINSLRNLKRAGAEEVISSGTINRQPQR